MEEAPVIKRLYVGGLGHTISETELQERFGKFGNVTETEIVTRKDEKGNPTKTFAYINITLSEKELKKCVSALNKTKWKGGTLQIELAKESFLHRLARERQEASIKKEKPGGNGMTDVLESMKKSGFTDFHMKAVPGTEVPNHKDWVVGKFGRVLPILHLKGQHRSKIIKYDPSKYCHNLKKLDQDLTEMIPISKLTWHLEEGDDSMSQKRQGHFPAYKPPKKKMRVQDGDSVRRTELHSYGQFSSKTTSMAAGKLIQSSTPKTKGQSKEHSAHQKLGTASTPCRHRNHLSESDIDSEEEIRAIIEREREVRQDNPDIEQEENMEVVREDFELKYRTHWSLQKAQDAKQAHTGCNGELRTTDNQSGYDSADTDEIIAVTRTPNNEKKEAPKESKADTLGKDEKPKMHATNSGSCFSNGLILDKPKRGGRAKPEKASDSKAEQNSITNKCKAGDSESSVSDLDTSEPEGDEDYKRMMQGCYRLDLTLEELERLASENTKAIDKDTASNPNDTPCKSTEFPVNSTGNIAKKSKEITTRKKGISPEEIISAILEGGSSDEENPKRKKLNLKVPPFRGIGSLSRELTKGELGTQDSQDNQTSSDLVDPEASKRVSQYSGSASKKPNCKSLKENSTDSLGACILKSGEDSDYSKLRAKSSEVESSGVSVLSERKNSKNLKSIGKETKIETSIKGSSFAHCKNMRSEEPALDSAKATSMSDKKEKQLQDNEKRLTALQERQKERELQKKLIQGALTSLETQSANKQKHIVFDSEDESENKDEVQESMKGGSSGQLLGKEFTTKTSGKLFESSDDESETTDEEDDRFKIKPHFEGKAGEKLMHLQSRFGTDERFRMDARFLESDSEQEDESKVEIDEEEELTLEKKRNLDILKNLLNIGAELSKPRKQTANAKKFKDMNTLRYDPTREDHAVFERKPENTEKESKAKRKKQKEEAQKLPEVSKEIFYDVTVDLKEILGSTKCDEKTEQIPWDKHEDVEEATPAEGETFVFSNGTDREEETSGFRFSFFGAEEERLPMKEEPYVIETIKASRVAWQEDPRFQDSSSEDDETEEVEREDVEEMSPALPQTNIRFFFFSRDDDRLKEGPKLFCKSSNLDEDRDDWESRRQTLLEDCRKKHKDARRKVKAKH
ncbi:nucleolar protein 8 isoform X1 [Zootoca vivipara]|uniref:nucleolar protein 8 isoform X1 n=1 Tax=Zootoca vivipara TaxID=8524 RepID=UPI00293BB7C2|nr:nucleolar protein 8 isoform X1 [Zootoca vivipara]